MSRDYAQVKASPPQAPEARSNSSLWMAFVVVVLLTGSFAGGYWLGMKNGGQTEVRRELEQQINAHQLEIAALKLELEKTRSEAEGHSTEVGDLTFYNDLPKQSVTPSPLGTEAPSATNGSAAGEKPVAKPEGKEPDKKEPSATAVAPRTQESSALLESIITRELMKGKPASSGPAFFVQTGSFQKQADALALSGKLKGKGYASRVESVDIPGKGTWHRVYAGPYVSRSEAEKAKARIDAQLKISGLIIKNGG